ncbi:MAG: transcriptional repressor [Candidatus Sedimenticola endophacoides]|uniref:Ferric uptake regulation protein n=1 Tax=Candidatus Sedimenticola endophacoides TaxID=2548426 RepID=A0A6N4DSR7_9GAMM|nr:MAG: transcriptional repressor [Candidatus Sedimenticola endophacoides]OQX34104.1 MAG: transcriptional repressor [Candidatus Sedimenticola endophacoides]OQX40124.1 MAG: transcriptional repressor [Candidatus Sedimenticola endophacoides]OQX40856.1 MAG: transcriptional repressor [Candidatus Sedimenticola endophacoides]PUD99721.1 MAG: transcriptional repressor [Candidatus Sedimenticola endophacoides]
MAEQKRPHTRIAEALCAAERICQANGARLTDQRRRVLEILFRADGPLGAYELLERLSTTLPSAKPPTVYRALDFLLTQGLVHRLESLNAFIGCTHPDHPHVSQFLICSACGRVQELEDHRVRHSIDRAIAGIGFEVESQVVEISGRCAGCRLERLQ